MHGLNMCIQGFTFSDVEEVLGLKLENCSSNLKLLFCGGYLCIQFLLCTVIYLFLGNLGLMLSMEFSCEPMFGFFLAVDNLHRETKITNSNCGPKHAI